MGSFDLNNPLDFARATNSFGAGLLQTLTPRGSKDWLIEEGKYVSGDDPTREVIFHVFRSAQDYGGAVSQISDSGGRRKAKYEFAFLDGQLTNDMGREAENFEIDIILHGNNYLQAFNRLMRILNEPTPGFLTHPVRGKIQCAMERYSITHQESARKAVSIKLTLTEHSLQAIQLLTSVDNSAPSRLSRLAATFVKIENFINKIDAYKAFTTSLKLQLSAGLSLYKDNFTKVSANMNAVFNSAGNIPALLPVQGGGLQNNDGQVITNVSGVAVSPNDALASLPPSLVSVSLQQALAIDQIQKDILTTRDLAAEIIAAVEVAGNGLGAFAFYSNLIDIRASINDMQLAFEAGKKSSQARIIDYVTPRVMSIREIGFANGITPDDTNQIALLNSGLESLNYIPKGTSIKVSV